MGQSIQLLPWWAGLATYGSCSIQSSNMPVLAVHKTWYQTLGVQEELPGPCPAAPPPIQQPRTEEEQKRVPCCEQRAVWEVGEEDEELLPSQGGTRRGAAPGHGALAEETAWPRLGGVSGERSGMRS